jgi:hypothetical protein
VPKTGATMSDGLGLNIIMLITPVRAIKQWQMAQ